MGNKPSDEQIEARQRLRVVIVGGGIAGARVAYQLQKTCKVILVDPSNFLEVRFATLRSLVEPNFASLTVIPHSEFLSNIEYVRAEAVGLTDKEVIVRPPPKRTEQQPPAGAPADVSVEPASAPSPETSVESAPTSSLSTTDESVASSPAESSADVLNQDDLALAAASGGGETAADAGAAVTATRRPLDPPPPTAPRNDRELSQEQARAEREAAEKFLEQVTGLQAGVTLRQVKQGKRVCDNCFWGQDAVTWMAAHLPGVSSADALVLGQRMLEEGAFFNIEDKMRPFQDNKTVYQFNARFDHRPVSARYASHPDVPGAYCVPYDVIILATGCQYGEPIYSNFGQTWAERRGHINSWSQRFARPGAKKLVIAGGGPIGVELAAEMADAFRGRGKTITLVHKGASLVEMTSEKSQAHCAAFLERRGVNVVLNERVADTMPPQQPGQPSTAVLTSGARVEFDEICYCYGSRPNSGWLRAYLGGSLDEYGRVKVNETLSVEGFKNVFAVGDIIDTLEEKLGYIAEKQAHVAARNVVSRLDEMIGQKSAPLQTYTPAAKNIIIVSLGKCVAVA